MKYIFVCRANLNRSPRAAEVFELRLRELGVRNPQVSSAGLEGEELFTPEEQETEYYKERLQEIWGVSSRTVLRQEMIDAETVVFALDYRTKEDIQKKFWVAPGQLIDLGIPDWFRNQKGNLEKLYEILWQVFEPYATRWEGSDGTKG